MTRILWILIGLPFFFVSLKSLAAEENLAGRQFEETAEADIAKKVKKRQYLGGRDESDLKIQTQVTTPSRKMAPQAELKVEEPAEE